MTDAPNTETEIAAALTAATLAGRLVKAGINEDLAVRVAIAQGTAAGVPTDDTAGNAEAMAAGKAAAAVQKAQHAMTSEAFR